MPENREVVVYVGLADGAASEGDKHNGTLCDASRRGAMTWAQRDVGMVARDELGQIKDVARDLVRGFLQDYSATHPGIRVPRRPEPANVPKA